MPARISVYSAGACLFLGAACTPVLGQVVERYTPPGQSAVPAPALDRPMASKGSNDGAPLGVVLREIVVQRAPDDTDATQKEPHRDRLDEKLRPLMGRQLSRALIANIEAVIVKHYRDTGRPFVSVTTPPQELTEGSLIVQVTEFRIGTLRVIAPDEEESSFVRRRIRLGSDDRIDAPDLIQDLEWLNRDPFRRIEVRFSPGSGFGQSDLELTATRQRPFRAFSGYANSGPRGQDRDRVFGGMQIGDLGTRGSLFSYLLTLDPDSLAHPARWTGRNRDDRSFVSHSGLAIVPVALRQDILASVNWIRSDQPVEAFLVRQTTIEGSLVHRRGIEIAGVRGDLTLGLELRRQVRDLVFDETRVFRSSADVAQLALGWSERGNIGRAQFGYTLFARVSPGGITSGNSDRAFALFTEGAATTACYVYGGLDYWATVPVRQGWVLSSSYRVQASSQRLLPSEQTILGGEFAVRGYGLEDGGFDMAAVSRNELQLQPLSVRSLSGSQVQPFAFFDAGYGRNSGDRRFARAAAAGLGFNVQVSTKLSLAMAMAMALVDGPATQSGDLRLHTRAGLSF